MTAAMARTIDTGWHPLVEGIPEPWASAWGQDRFGVYLAFAIEGASQRMRWIPPGRFLMGSPEDEPGRFAWESPPHPITLAEGFWLFDTPCTQALWQAVMGGNPSKFPNPQRPVENVSIPDVQAFLARANAMRPGLDLVLPAETQWEYAARAGTETATYAGSMTIVGERNALMLDPIAWYGGNSGVGSDIPNARDSRHWPEKQYDHALCATHPVARKVANPLGFVRHARECVGMVRRPLDRP